MRDGHRDLLAPELIRKPYLEHSKIFVLQWSATITTDETTFGISNVTPNPFWVLLAAVKFKKDTRQELPQNYPVDGSVELNERIAFIIAEGEMKIGPSIVTQVRSGQKVRASVEYFYEEDAPGATYDNLGFFVDEILVSLASSAAGVVRMTDGQLINIASGNTPIGGQLYQLLSNSIDTTDISRPHGYLVYASYDNRGNLLLDKSGAKQVSEPNQLRTILTDEITARHNGFMHIYVSNGSSNRGVSFDQFMVTIQKGKTRQFYDYYPYGLPIADIHENLNRYLNKYTAKEHQTGEYMSRGIDQRGLEMFDFHARFFDPQLARWHAPDPAMQFSNPYLGIGNNPVMYVDPDGEFVFFIPHVSFGNGSFDIGLTVGLGLPKAASVQATVGHTFQEGADNSYASVGGSLGGFTASVGYGKQTGMTAGVGFGFGPVGVNSNVFSAGVSWSENYGTSVNAFGASYGKGGFGFNPTLGFSHGFGWETSTKEIDPTAGAIASSDPKYVAYGPEYEHVEKLSPSQRFAQWARNRRKWSMNISYSRNFSYPKFKPLGTVSVGFTAEVAFPRNWGNIRGGGISLGLVADHTVDGMGHYITRKLPQGDYSASLSLGFDFSYTTSNSTTQTVIERLQGNGHSISGDAGYVGGEYGADVARSYQQIGLNIPGWSVGFGGSTWNTHTNITPWFR